MLFDLLVRWGLIHVDDFLAIRPDPDLELSWELDFEWSRIVPLGRVAPKSEYTKRGKGR